MGTTKQNGKNLQLYLMNNGDGEPFLKDDRYTIDDKSDLPEEPAEDDF